ncbi:MAG: glycoside hydrolase family 97 protein [Bacteroides sp.]
MKLKIGLIAMSLAVAVTLQAEEYKAVSPDGQVVLTVNNAEKLTYSVTYRGETMIAASPMGFEFVREKPMDGGFRVMEPVQAVQRVEEWTPVVPAKHAHVRIPYTYLRLPLREEGKDYRRMDVEFRVMDEGVAFRYTLYGARRFDYRRVQKELTGFAVPNEATAWMSQYRHPYSSSQESEFVPTPIVQQNDSLVKGLPYLIEVNRQRYMAILEADMNEWPGFYIGREQQAEQQGRVMLGVRLAPFGDDDETEIKVLFADRKSSSWRVVLMAENPGRFIESEVVRSLNPDCAVADAAEWVKPGMSAWDTWWSIEDAVTLPEAKKYVDMAAAQGWPYMLVDWKWYGKYNHVSAVPLQCADYMNVPELIAYAKEKGVGIWVWIHSSDITQQDHWREAFPLYERWGVKGVKIDFMDHENQYATTWYRKMIAEAARHHLMIDFHGAYKPDGVDRTYPNMMTREGVLGEEYSKFSTRITPEHNITLCFTRLLAGQMDYTPGGFLNVTREQFLKDWEAAGEKLIRPAEIMNTRCQELAKFVIYESPVTVFCEHPDRCLGQPGMDFLREVKTVWSDTRFLDGYPAEHIELAKQAADGRWFVAGMNNSTRRTVQLDLSFLGEGMHTATLWMDAKDADRYPTKLVKKQIKVSASKPCKVEMNVGGGFVMIVE